MPAKPKHALVSPSAARETLEEAFGPEKGLALIVAADCGASVARTFKRFCTIESFLLAKETREGIERAMFTTAASEKDETGYRRVKIKHPVIIHAGHIFTDAGVPHPELRQGLADLAPSLGTFADALDHLQRLYDLGTQLAAFYAAHPDRTGLLGQLSNDKKLMAVYATRAASTLGITERLTTTELAALGIVIGIEEPNSDRAQLSDNWRKVRASVAEIEGTLKMLPSFSFLW